ncbi:hypothetical protein M408DRAFT_87697 [Serendipita vermifera MAFF 305830]|uniref:Uncharacterized protein n=1 Tax=Serendipita vermifera MAFF 305830 TaxID=933852 RepID=A0A0C3BAS9_SERVB|nr:hypothetical protein M408DRAFT_87697 [Serendipita vermifera MAFF 305830]
MVLAISIAMPVVPAPWHPALSTVSNRLGSQQSICEDDSGSTIIPPTPPNNRRPPVTVPLHFPDQPPFSAIPGPLRHHDEDGADVKEDMVLQHHSEAPPFSVHRPSGTRLDPRSRSRDFRTPKSMHQMECKHPRPSIKILWDTAVINPRTRSTAIEGEDRKENEPTFHDEFESISRSRIVKSLTPESSEIIVNLPGPSLQATVPKRHRSPDRLPNSTNTHVRSDFRHSPHERRSKEMIHDHFTSHHAREDGPNTSNIYFPSIQVNEFSKIHGPVVPKASAHLPSRRRGSKSPYLPLSSSQRRRQRSGDILPPTVIIPQSTSRHEVTGGPIQSRESSVDKRARSGKKGNGPNNFKRNANIPNHVISPVRGLDPALPHAHIVSPIPLRIKTVPSIVTGPIDLQESFAQTEPSRLHPTILPSNHIHPVHSSSGQQTQPLATIIFHRGNRVELEGQAAPTVVFQDIVTVLGTNEVISRASPTILPNYNSRSASQSFETGLHVAPHEHAQDQENLLTHTTLSTPANTRSHTTILRGARKRDVQGDKALGSSTNKPRTKSSRRMPEDMSEGSLGAAVSLYSQNQVGGSDGRVTSTTRPRPSGSKKQGGDNRKRVNDTLSIISERSEPQIASPSPKVIEQGGENEKGNDYDLDGSEQVRDVTFDARQAERQRTLEEEIYKERQTNERLLLALKGSIGKDSAQNPKATSPMDRHKQYTPQMVVDSVSPSSKMAQNGHLPTVHLKSRPLPQPLITRTSRHGTATVDANIPASLLEVENREDRRSSSGHLPHPNGNLPSPGAASQSMGTRTSTLIQPLYDNQMGLVKSVSYAQELAEERAKAHRLQEEIEATRAAIQAIKDERVGRDKKLHADVLDSISVTRHDVRGQIRSLTDQVVQTKKEQRYRKERSPDEVTFDTIDGELRGLVDRLIEGQAAERRLRLEDRAGAAAQTALEMEIEHLRQQNAAQKILIEDMLGRATRENQQQREILFNVFKQASEEQVKVNVDERLHEFTDVMTHEVCILLSEVGNLREQRRNLQHEIGCLLCFRSKMEAGGEFDASWDPMHGPKCTHFPVLDTDANVRPGGGGPPFAGTTPSVKTKLPRGPVTPAPGLGKRGGPSMHTAVASPSPAYGAPRKKLRGERAPGLPVGSDMNQANTTQRPPHSRTSRKARGKHPD